MTNLNERLNQQIEQLIAERGPANIYSLYKDLVDFKKYLDQVHKNHPGYSLERKEALNVVIDLVRELKEG